jgi:hypothetical protein
MDRQFAEVNKKMEKQFAEVNKKLEIMALLNQGMKIKI